MYHTQRNTTPPPPPNKVPIPIELCEHCHAECLITDMFVVELFSSIGDYSVALCPKCTTFALNNKEY
jgi:hypothetical protein